MTIKTRYALSDWALGAPGGAHQLAQAAVVTPHCDCIIWRTPFN